MMDGGWFVNGGLLAPRDGRVSPRNEFPPVVSSFITRSSRTNQPTAPRAQGVLLYVLLHCCSAVLLYVVNVGLLGEWMENCFVRGGWVGRFVRGNLFSSCVR